MIAHIYPLELHVVSGRGYAGCLEGCFQGYRGEAMQDPGYELPRISIPRTWVNKGTKVKGQSCLGSGPVRVASSVALLLLFWNETKLLQQAQIVVSLPCLGYPVAFEAVNGDAFKLKGPASRRTKPLHLSLVSTALRPADRYLLTLA